VQWIADSSKDLGGSLPELPQAKGAAPVDPVRGRNAFQSILDEDIRSQQAFLDRWGPRVAVVTNARHQKMLELILGEMAEHLRVFQQARDGRTDLLGKHTAGKVQRGDVLSARPLQ
jgi:hypothetical protein